MFPLLPRTRRPLARLFTTTPSLLANPPKPRRPAVRPPPRPPSNRSHLSPIIPASAQTVATPTRATEEEIRKTIHILDALPADALPPAPRSALTVPFSIGGLALLGLGIWMYTYQHDEGPPYNLNPIKFSTYHLGKHTNVAYTNRSQTAVLELEPVWEPDAGNDGAVVSVELRQPFIQIVRHYTPLPGGEDGKIRLLVKRVEQGEMSRYVMALPEGAEVGVRGEYVEWELPAEKGARVLFLAGGTGVAPALQGAEKLLRRDEQAQMRILWAVRWPEEVGGAVAEMVKGLEEKFKGRLEVKCYVDAVKPLAPTVVQEAVSWGPSEVVVSGPDGFIGYWAGLKEWVGGEQVQGKVGGVVGHLVKETGVKVWKL